MSDSTEQPIPLRKKLFTQPFGDWVDTFLGSADKRFLNEGNAYLALSLKAFDKDELLIHVEFPSKDNLLKFPVVWRKEEWCTNYEEYKKRKAREEIERIKWCKFKENLERATKALCVLNGLDYEQNEPMILDMVKKKDKRLFEFLGATFDE